MAFFLHHVRWTTVTLVIGAVSLLQGADSSGPTTDDMIEIPAGKFFMGCHEQTDTNCRQNEKPGQLVFLDAFLIDRHEITIEEYRKCLAAKACQELKTDQLANLNDPEREKFPIHGVSWLEAKTYCEWLGKRLPTEAEWEKAARGTDARIVPWQINNKNLDALTAPTKAAVRAGCSQPNHNSPYGVCDLSGNVWEWVADWYQPNYYSRRAAHNPLGPISGKYKVLRGGSWLSLPEHRRTSFRGRAQPEFQSTAVGFRCVRSE